MLKLLFKENEFNQLCLAKSFYETAYCGEKMVFELNINGKDAHNAINLDFIKSAGLMNLFEDNGALTNAYQDDCENDFPNSMYNIAIDLIENTIKFQIYTNCTWDGEGALMNNKLEEIIITCSNSIHSVQTKQY